MKKKDKIGKENVEVKNTSKSTEEVKKKPDIVLIILYIVLFIILAFLIYTKIKNIGRLRNDDKLAVELHDYFSTSDLGLCGGLFNYGPEKMTYDDIDSSSKLCIAYHKSDIEGAKALSYEAKKIDSTCDVDGLIFKTDEGTKNCTVTKIDRKIIDNTYKKIFGKDIEDNDTFKFDGYHVCYLKDDSYYCGLSEYYKVTYGNEINVYRSVDRVTKKKDVITIYDYFAKVVNGEDCYKDYKTQNINSVCKDNLIEGQLKYDFLKDYGVRYKHIYKKAQDGTYYWVSSEPIYDPNDPEKYSSEEE